MEEMMINDYARQLMDAHGQQAIAEAAQRAAESERRAVIAFTSEAKEGVDVCTTAKSKFLACATTSANEVLCGGASISLLSATIAAGCASQVGYQKDATSRFV
jgi:hypothetical protein